MFEESIPERLFCTKAGKDKKEMKGVNTPPSYSSFFFAVLFLCNLKTES